MTTPARNLFKHGKSLAVAALAVISICNISQAQSTLDFSAESGAVAPVKTDYLTGGALAGLNLPDSPRGPAPEVELYPGSVEHYRSEYMKYVPIRSFFDAQSMLKNWVLPDLPAMKGKVEQFAPPIYDIGRDTTNGPTGKFQPPVSCVRVKPLDPVFKLDLGELRPSMYAVRVIAAVETAKLHPWRAPVYFVLKVNDGLNGETSTYRVRSSYTDDFYSVVELYFNAPETRHYQAELYLDKGSQMDLLVHNITLDDVLAGTTRRPIKQKQTLTTPEEIAHIKELYSQDHDTQKWVSTLPTWQGEERLARDAKLWKYFPPINSQGSWTTAKLIYPAFEVGSADKTGAEIEQQYGKWESPRDDSNAFLVNKKLGLTYTYDDLWAHKPLPDPYPYKDDGAGLYFPDPNDPSKGRRLSPIADEISERFRVGSGRSGWDWSTEMWLKTGRTDFARDGAIQLVRFAYQYPSMEVSNYLDMLTYIPEPGRDLRFRQREDFAHWMAVYFAYGSLTQTYDRLYPYIKGNEELAQSIHRFIPWVHTSNDVIQLLDTYLTQTLAKRILRYHYVTLTNQIADVSATLADNSVTDPWMQWFFSKAFQYPLPLAGIQDLLITANDREGPQSLGSTFYCINESALGDASSVMPYLRAGGNPKYSLLDLNLYPKAVAETYWALNTTVGGQDFLRIGDVTGPEKVPGLLLHNGAGDFRAGWQITGDPKFAWLLANVAGRTGQTDDEWQKVEAAAATVKRAPFLDLRSRSVNNWATILESGLQHDDYRYRRAAYVRTGIGTGHDHADSLDLQIFAHGVPMTIDGGQRSGYTKPNDKFSRIHNTVEVDGGGNEEYGVHLYSWTQNLADAPGARYAKVNALPPPGAKYFNRQVALVDADETAPQKLPIEQQKPGTVLPKVASTPNSYVFDVFRVSGGSVHNYNFHGTVDDDFSWNAENVKPVETVPSTTKPKTDAEFLSIFEASPESKMGGDAPQGKNSALEATWRLSQNEFSGEKADLGVNFDPAAPRKYTRLHLLNAEGLRALRAQAVSTQYGYRFTNLTAVKRGVNLESAFTAIIEPYEGKPFLTSEKLLDVANNEDDAQRAVAVEVQTKSGHDDINFADGRPDKTRTVGDMNFSGEYAFVSHDAQGLRQASLASGTLLSTPDVRITAAAREYSAKVLAVNYPQKRLQLDKPFPAASAGRVFEIGTPDKWTSYTSDSINGSTLTVTKGADFYRSPIQQFVENENRVDAKLNNPLGFGGGLPGAGWIVSNDDASKTWRSKKINGNDFYLDGPVKAADFPGGVLRVWEYGVGDSVRESTSVSLNRSDSGFYELRGDVDVTIGLKAKTVEFSGDGKSWRKLSGKANNGLYECSIGLSKLTAQPVYLRISR